MSISSANAPVAYTTVQDVVKLLNLQQSAIDPNKYLVWQIPTSVDILNTFIKYANQQATQIYGNQTTSSNLGLVQQWATWKAVQNMIFTMTVNWVISGLPVTVGNIGFDRLAAMAAASSEIKQRAENELFRLYTLLSNIDVVNNYRSPSPYVDTGGQTPYF